MASEIDTSAEAVEQLAAHITGGQHEAWEIVCASTLRALAAECDAAVEAAVQAERADCARHIDARVAGWRNAENPEDETVNGYLAFAGQLLSHEIRARGPADALAAALAKAREEAFREAELAARRLGESYSKDSNKWPQMHHCAAAAQAVEAAIRALAGKEQGK